MSRSGYVDDPDNLAMWRGAVESAIRGKRGQAFLREMLAAMDAMPVKRLIANELVSHGEVCAIGVVGQSRGVDMSGIDPEDRDAIANAFNIAPAMAAEIMYYNDEEFNYWRNPTTGKHELASPEGRFRSIYDWIESLIKEPKIG